MNDGKHMTDKAFHAVSLWREGQYRHAASHD